MKQLLIFFISLFFLSCQTKKKDILNSFPLIKKNLNSNIKLLRSEQFTSNPDYSHPQHNYFLFTGPPDKLVSFVKSMHLLPFVKDSIYPTLPLEEYGGGKLWDVDGFRDYPKDANIRERFKVTSIKKANYAAYFNSGKENNVFNNPDNNWNGKITATLKGV